MSRGRAVLRRTGALAVALVAVLAAAPPRSAYAQAPRDSTAARRDSSAVQRAARDTTARSFVPPDSLPSDDARAVLRTIPEPLPPGEVVPADSSAFAPVAPAFPAPDTSAADTSGVPTPALTAPLGERPEGPRRAVLDTAATEPAATPPSSAPPASTPAAPPAAITAPADTCWRVQVAAYNERPVAESHRVAAASQLLVPMAIENENGRLKIRTSDCLTRSAAESLRRRAYDSGFPGAFLLRMGAKGEAIPVGAPPPAAAPKKPAVKRTSAASRGAVPSATTPVRKKTARR